MQDVLIGPGVLLGKGVYARRRFTKGEVVIRYALTPLAKAEAEALPAEERGFVHSHHGRLFLYGEPERYVNHSDHPNTFQDLKRGCDIAARTIEAGEEITTDASKDDVK